MSDLYNDADVEAAQDALDEWLFRAHGLVSSSRAVLDAVAPAIAARALREFADWAEQSDLDEYPFDGLDATVQTIRARADAIEAGQ